MGLVLYGGFPGWETSNSVSLLYDKHGNIVPGVLLTMNFARSGSVKFFSLFIVMLMWFVSLSIFIIAVFFALSPSSEPAFDVPALAIGLLFAIPFVRGVQPNVPTVGISIDIMGFFFNMILIAAAAILSLGAAASRYAHLSGTGGAMGDMEAPAPKGVIEHQVHHQQVQQSKKVCPTVASDHCHPGGDPPAVPTAMAHGQGQTSPLLEVLHEASKDLSYLSGEDHKGEVSPYESRAASPGGLEHGHVDDGVAADPHLVTPS